MGKPIRNRPRLLKRESMGCLGLKQSDQGFLVENPNSLHVYIVPLSPKNVAKSSTRVSGRFGQPPLSLFFILLLLVFVNHQRSDTCDSKLSKVITRRICDCYCYITIKGNSLNPNFSLEYVRYKIVSLGYIACTIEKPRSKHQGLHEHIGCSYG